MAFRPGFDLDRNGDMDGHPLLHRVDHSPDVAADRRNRKALKGHVDRLVLTQKDRLPRFGAELVFAICEMKDIEVVIINQGEEPTFEEELAQDVLEIITVFSARLYGNRSDTNQK